MSKKKLNASGTLLNLLLLGGAAVILKKRTGSLRGIGRIGATKRYYYQLLDDNYDEYNLYLPDGIDRRTAKKMAKEFMKKNDIKEEHYTNKIQEFLKNEKDKLLRIKNILTGTEKLSPESTEKTLTKLITSSDYLYLHFPDGWQFNYSQSFLNRIRNEVEFFLKLYE